MEGSMNSFFFPPKSFQLPHQYFWLNTWNVLKNTYGYLSMIYQGHNHGVNIERPNLTSHPINRSWLCIKYSLINFFSFNEFKDLWRYLNFSIVTFSIRKPTQVFILGLDHPSVNSLISMSPAASKLECPVVILSNSVKIIFDGIILNGNMWLSILIFQFPLF